jgi:hypothetical protein
LLIKDFRLLRAEWNCLRISLVRKLFLVVLFMVFKGSRIIKFEVELLVAAPKPAIVARPPGPIINRSNGCGV